MPKISVLIPTYNMGRFLDDAIKSVLTQTLNDYELIIVDNASTDNTEDIVNKYLSDKRVKYYKNTFNVGMARNWNICLLLSTAQYIKFLNADDKLYKNNLKEMSFILDNEPSVSLVSSWRDSFGNSEFIKKTEIMNNINGKHATALSLIEGNWIGEPTIVMFRRKNLYLGLFNTKFHWLPDWDMWLRQLTVGDLYIIPQVLSSIRVHENQLTAELQANYVANFEEYYYAKELNDYRYFQIPDDVYIDFLNQKLVNIICMIPKILKSNNSNALKKTMNIILNEGQFIKSIGLAIKKIVTKAINRLDIYVKQ